MRNSTVGTIKASIDVKRRVCDDDVLLEKIKDCEIKCLESINSGGKIIFCGNGGSFADAQHLSGEFVSRFMFDRKPLASIVLGANSSTITAIGNDYGYDKVFSRELSSVAGPKDVFIPITTSGESSNIVSAVKTANEIGIVTIALTGRSGGQLIDLCDCICVPSDSTPRIQECHILIGHIICEHVEAKKKKKN